MIRKDREAPEHEQTIKVMFTQGRRGTEIAKELGLCRKLVNRIIYDRLKLRSTRPRVNTNYTDEQVNRIIHLYRWGYDVFEIKEEMGGTVYKIQNVLKYAGEIERLADWADIRTLAGSIEPATDRNQDAAAIHPGVLSAEKTVFGGLIVENGRS
jgi:hypothetical protein